MMGHRQAEQAALFYEFSLERHVPANHLLRSIDRFIELGEPPSISLGGTWATSPRRRHASGVRVPRRVGQRRSRRPQSGLP